MMKQCPSVFLVQNPLDYHEENIIVDWMGLLFVIRVHAIFRFLLLVSIVRLIFITFLD